LEKFFLGPDDQTERSPDCRGHFGKTTLDWAWGVDLQRIEQAALRNMISLNSAFDLPFFAGSRQDPKISAERAAFWRGWKRAPDRLRPAQAELVSRPWPSSNVLERALDRNLKKRCCLSPIKSPLAMADYRSGKR